MLKRRVYPRVCGGTSFILLPNTKSTDAVYPRVCGGTSCSRSTTMKAKARSIPACAGEPALCTERIKRTETVGLSPRVRGNHLPARWVDLRKCRGLSPRVRGNHSLYS